MKKSAWIWAIPLLLAGCGSTEPSASTTEEPTVATPDVDEPAPADDSEAGPVVDDPSYELRATATGPYTAGAAGTFDILLTSRGNYHVNEDYPMTVTLSGPDEVTWPSSELGNDDTSERTLERARFEVPFTAGAGEHRVMANVDFAVCTPETCIPEMRTLALLLPVE